MTQLRSTLILALWVIGLSPAAALAGLANPADALRVEGEQFRLTLPDGRRLTSADLVGAQLETEAGQTIRIDSLTPSKERAGVLLHAFSILNLQTGTWTPTCDKDAYGRAAGFPVAGRWDAHGRYVKDASHWFLTCTSGSQGKCILWGYDPWGRGPHGEDLAPYYQACQFTVRANYDGLGEAHTRNGTSIDVNDNLGIQISDTGADPRYVFEAGWGPAGAVCVARTRWPELLPLATLLRSAPRLGGVCNEAQARRRGALIFTRVMRAPVVVAPLE